MTTLTKFQQKNYIEFLDKAKGLVGLHAWKILLGIEATNLGENILATCDPNIYEQTLKIALSEDFLTKDTPKQANILIHELVHARVCIFNKKIEELNELEEELMVNDITRGLEQIPRFVMLLAKEKKVREKEVV